MRRTALLCLIFTFLSAAGFKAHAQDRDSLLFEAACCERIVFDSQNPREAGEALIRKAELYKQAGEYAGALETLERVRMFVLTPDERRAVIIQKALCAFMDGSYDTSMTYLSELGIAPGYQEPRLKKDWLAMALTLLVPAGYIYAGAPGEGAVSTALNACSVAWIVLNLSAGVPVTALLGGALALSYTYLGAQERVAFLVEKSNSSKIAAAKRDAAGKALLGLL